MKVDLNELGEAAYNELKRIEFLPDRNSNELNDIEINDINDLIYNKIGDTLLKQVIKYKDCKPDYISYDFNPTAGFILLILVLALCYINYMNLNDYFNLTIKDE